MSGEAWYLTFNWSVLPFYSNAAPIVYSLMSVDSQSADLVGAPLINLKNIAHCSIWIHMSVFFVFLIKTTWCAVHLAFLSVWKGSYLLSFPTFWCMTPWFFPLLFPLGFWDELSALMLQHNMSIRSNMEAWFILTYVSFYVYESNSQPTGYTLHNVAIYGYM